MFLSPRITPPLLACSTDWSSFCVSGLILYRETCLSHAPSGKKADWPALICSHAVGYVVTWRTTRQAWDQIVLHVHQSNNYRNVIEWTWKHCERKHLNEISRGLGRDSGAVVQWSVVQWSVVSPVTSQHEGPRLNPRSSTAFLWAWVSSVWSGFLPQHAL